MNKNKLNGAKPVVPEKEPLLQDIRGFFRITGIPMESIRKGQARGQIPEPIRFGRRLRWRTSDILAWVEDGCPDQSKRTPSRRRSSKGGVR